MTEQTKNGQTVTTAVIGIGNILLKDDGVGVHVVQALKGVVLPSTIILVDGGTSTLDMLDYFLDYQSLIVIDALRGGEKPGTLYKLSPEAMAGLAKKNLSLHDVQILDVIQMAQMLDSFPEVTIYGIEPEEVTYGLEMSETLKNAFPGIVDTIYKGLTDRL